ncbi:aminodeoxychorismate synthase component I [Oxalobacteraceae bacterium OM1]|nr:aminodeoxychorismate synthase component I [Oxalobacteraceae bacterium OM1]
MPAPADCFALLDDCHASTADPRSRLYTGLVRALPCRSAAELPQVLQAMEDALRQGLHAVTLFSYELGADMHGIAPREHMAWPSQVLLFADCMRLSAADMSARLDAHAQGMAGVARMHAEIDEAAFTQAIDRIHAYIEAGDTYQVNYTYRLRFDAYGEPLALYRRLRERQLVPYGACVQLPDGTAVLSLSPELFVRHDKGVLTAQPMKGTAAASSDADEDARRAVALAADAKNRAENLMIVDLLRNDLGRIAETGSVHVPQLFKVDRFSSVLQMTSTVEARLRPGAQLVDVFAALYPCGSITGAPKRRTMQIIRELEASPRGLYTGTIGWFDGLGAFCLSVPIRTLVLQPPVDGVRAGELGVGAGIVHDSVAREEFAECALKAGFLTGLPHAFELFETMRGSRAEGVPLLERHLARLEASAAYFGMAWDEAQLRAAVTRACGALTDDAAHRVRLALRPDGSCQVRTGILADIAEPVRVLIAEDRTHSDELFLRHKTSVRTRYDAAWQAAERQGAFDTLFFNERGELTEGGRSNVFVRRGTLWLTPPLTSGVLPGVMRAVLIAQWQAQEVPLTRNDLHAADEIVVCNALRGTLRAVIA